MTKLFRKCLLLLGPSSSKVAKVSRRNAKPRRIQFSAAGNESCLISSFVVFYVTNSARQISYFTLVLSSASHFDVFLITRHARRGGDVNSFEPQPAMAIQFLDSTGSHWRALKSFLLWVEQYGGNWVGEVPGDNRQEERRAREREGLDYW